MRSAVTSDRTWKPPGKAVQAAVFIAMLPIYLPLLVILYVWNVFKRATQCEAA